MDQKNLELALALAVPGDVGTATNFPISKTGKIEEPTSRAVVRIKDMYVKPCNSPSTGQLYKLQPLG